MQGNCPGVCAESGREWDPNLTLQWEHPPLSALPVLARIWELKGRVTSALEHLGDQDLVCKLETLQDLTSPSGCWVLGRDKAAPGGVCKLSAGEECCSPRGMLPKEGGSWNSSASWPALRHMAALCLGASF